MTINSILYGQKKPVGSLWLLAFMALRPAEFPGRIALGSLSIRSKCLRTIREQSNVNGLLPSVPDSLDRLSKLLSMPGLRNSPEAEVSSERKHSILENHRTKPRDHKNFSQFGKKKVKPRIFGDKRQNRMPVRSVSDCRFVYA